VVLSLQFEMVYLRACIIIVIIVFVFIIIDIMNIIIVIVVIYIFIDSLNTSITIVLISSLLDHKTFTDLFLCMQPAYHRRKTRFSLAHGESGMLLSGRSHIEQKKPA
jgi:hypothetical protein